MKSRMTKAERIYTDTYLNCRRHIRTWGYEENVGFNRLSYNDNETVCTRTFNEIQKYIDKDKKILETDIKLDILDAATIKLNKQVLDMVQTTLDNTIKSHSSF